METFVSKTVGNPRERSKIYAEETSSMNDAITMNNSSGRPSMRRTLLTLLGATAAFGILTASYATAELPEQAPAATVIGTVDLR